MLRTFTASLATVYTVCHSTSVQVLLGPVFAYPKILCAMSALLTESTAVLKERAAKVGLPDDALQRLLDQGVDTLAKLAFAPGHPGESPSDEKLKALVAPVAAPGGAGGAEPSLGTVAAVRRLVFEAQTLVVNETKCLVENKEEQPKELPPAERRDRLQKQAARLAGVDLSGVNECSHASYDLCLKLISDNCVSYLQPSKFTCRQAELRMDKPRKELDVAAPGSSSSVLLIKDRAAEQHCDVTHALDLFQALHRRALAMDLVGLSTYARVQEWNSFLMNHLQQPVLAGYRSPTVQQLLHADRAAWVRLSELTPAGVRRKATGELPLDSLWADLQKDPRVVFHLLPLPDSSGKHPAPAPPGVPDPPEGPPAKRPRKPKGKGKGKEKQTPTEPANLPSELRGLSSWTRTGKRRCWGFNMAAGCPGAKAGQTCSKGLHVCMRCGGMHGAHVCPKKPA